MINFSNNRKIVAAMLLANMLLWHVPTAKAQDIAAVCGTDPAVKTTGTTAKGHFIGHEADAQPLIGFALQPGLSAVPTTGFLSGILSSNIIPVVGQIISIAYFGYMLINKLLHRAPLPGPGALTRGPEGYALVGMGYGSDDHGATMNFWEGELQSDGSVKLIDYRTTGSGYSFTMNGVTRSTSNTGDLPRRAYERGGDDSGSPDVFVPKDKYAVGWTFVPSRTSGGIPYKENYTDGSPPLPCFFQMFRKIDSSTGMLVGPILGWSGVGDPSDNLNSSEYNGSCDERGYRGGYDLKIVKMVSDLPDPSNGYLLRQTRDPDDKGCKQKNFLGQCTFQGEPPVVDFPVDPPPSRRVIVGARFELANDADVGSLCLAFNNSGKITVRSRKVEDPDADLSLLFDLQGPTAAPPGSKTLYQNENAKFGSYSLTVPPGTDALFPGYTCTLRLVDSSIDPNNPTSLLDTGDVVDCNSTLTGQLDAIKSAGADGTEFIIEFEKGACQPKSCAQVVAGGAQCGKFPDGCSPCDPASQDPAQTAGCLDCGSCSGAGEVCTAQGQCSADFEASCSMVPGTIFTGQSADFKINTANGTAPFSCVWQSPSNLIEGRNTCAFTQTFPDTGTYDAAVTVTDSSSPTKEKTVVCQLTVVPDDPGCTGPAGAPAAGGPSCPLPKPIPNYSICEMYKVLIRYGMPIFAIMIVIAGLYILMSLGDPSRVTKGKQALSAGVGGLLILLLAKPIFTIIIGFLGFSVVLCGTVIP